VNTLDPAFFQVNIKNSYKQRKEEDAKKKKREI